MYTIGTFYESVNIQYVPLTLTSKKKCIMSFMIMHAAWINIYNLISAFKLVSQETIGCAECNKE